MQQLKDRYFWGKLKWVAGGATDMLLKIGFDLLLYWLPFALLIRITSIKIISFIK